MRPSSFSFLFSSKNNLVLLPLLLFLGASTSHALIILNTTDAAVGCSTTCESKHCVDALFLRYGKYCGLGYTGCKGEAPCDGLDACCKAHDDCIGIHYSNYLNVTCNQNLLDCISAYKASGAPQFSSKNIDEACTVTLVENTISLIMEIAIGIGKIA